MCILYEVLFEDGLRNRNPTDQRSRSAQSLKSQNTCFNIGDLEGEICTFFCILYLICLTAVKKVMSLYIFIALLVIF